jgi:hypothetical protein
MYFREEHEDFILDYAHVILNNVCSSSSLKSWLSYSSSSSYLSSDCAFIVGLFFSYHHLFLVVVIRPTPDRSPGLLLFPISLDTYWRCKIVLKFTASVQVTWCLFHQGGSSLDLSIQGSKANSQGPTMSSGRYVASSSALSHCHCWTSE